ncbi:hypothetical protein NF552_23050 (plasmid) [Roseomonas mucosa]|nr:hypothetical protein NF552_23050 [Roseomonas mucosa]
MIATLPPDMPRILTPKVVEDVVEDAYGLVRTDCSPPVEVAIVHDGTDRGVGETQIYVDLLARSPGMRRLLDEALLFEATAFDADEPVSGADLVEWFAS